MRYLAVITPYAEFTFRYSDPANTKNTVAIKYKRRAFVMPAPPKTVKHHPSSIDLVIMANLIRLAKDNKMVRESKSMALQFFYYSHRVFEASCARRSVISMPQLLTKLSLRSVTNLRLKLQWLIWFVAIHFMTAEN